MNFNDFTMAQIIEFIIGVGVIAGFCYKIFSVFNQVKINTKDISTLKLNISESEEKQKIEKQDIVQKVEETNSAVNLLCSAVSALIEDSIQDNQESKEQLKEIKRKLDNKKEIV